MLYSLLNRERTCAVRKPHNVKKYLLPALGLVAASTISTAAEASFTVNDVDLGEFTDCQSKQGEITLNNQTATGFYITTQVTETHQLSINNVADRIFLPANSTVVIKPKIKPLTTWHEIGTTIAPGISFTRENTLITQSSYVQASLSDRAIICNTRVRLGNNLRERGVAGVGYAWGDIDRDGDLDLIAYKGLTGSANWQVPSWRLDSDARANNKPAYGVTPDKTDQLVMLENINGQLQEPTLILDRTGSGEIGRVKEMELIDLNGDNRLELVYRAFTGSIKNTYTNTNPEHDIFYVELSPQNTTQSISYEAKPLNLPPSADDIVWADFDQDGDLDVAVWDARPNNPIYTIWLQTEEFVFTQKQNIVFHNRPTEIIDAHITDVDSDGDKDILLSYDYPYRGKDLIENNSNNDAETNRLFTVKPNYIVPNSYNGGTFFTGNFGADKALQTAISGEVYNQQGNPSYAESYQKYSSIFWRNIWGDFNNDGQYDLLSGLPYSRRNTYTTFPADFSQAITHQDLSLFKEQLFAVRPIFGNGESNSHGAIADYDRDGRLEIATLYTQPNDADLVEFIAPANNRPNRPEMPIRTQEVKVFAVGEAILLDWLPGDDAETPEHRLTYNVYLQNTQTGEFIVSPQADLSTGIGYIDVTGNALQNLSYIVKDLPVGEYSWGVQTVDTGLARSRFSRGYNFSVASNDCEVDLSPEITQVLDFRDDNNANSRGKYSVYYLLENNNSNCESGALSVNVTVSPHSQIQTAFLFMNPEDKTYSNAKIDTNTGSVTMDRLRAGSHFAINVNYENYQWNNPIHHDYDLINTQNDSDTTDNALDVDLAPVANPQQAQGDASLKAYTMGRNWGNFGYTVNYLLITNESNITLNNIDVGIERNYEKANRVYKSRDTELDSSQSFWTIKQLRPRERKYLYTITWHRGNSTQTASNETKRTYQAEIMSMDEDDRDSTPGNQLGDLNYALRNPFQEDDYVSHEWNANDRYIRRR